MNTYLNAISNKLIFEYENTDTSVQARARSGTHSLHHSTAWKNMCELRRDASEIVLHNGNGKSALIAVLGPILYRTHYDCTYTANHITCISFSRLHLLLLLLRVHLRWIAFDLQLACMWTLHFGGGGKILEISLLFFFVSCVFDVTHDKLEPILLLQRRRWCHRLLLHRIVSHTES